MKASIAFGIVRYAIILASVFVVGWMFMVLVGMARAEWLPALPTVGYWKACVLVVVAEVVLAIRVVFAEMAKALGDD